MTVFERTYPNALDVPTAAPGIQWIPLDEPVSEVEFPFVALHVGDGEAGRLAPRELQLRTLHLREDERIEVSAWASGDVDIYVIDPFGDLIAFDNSCGGKPHCRIQPGIAGEYLVKLVNSTDAFVNYRLWVRGDLRLGRAVRMEAGRVLSRAA